MSKLIDLLMPLGIDFWKDFKDFGYHNEAKLKSKWNPKWMLTSSDDFWTNLISPKEIPLFLRSKRSKLGAKTNQKSIKKWSPKYNASEHRFSNDFVGFWDPSWGQVGGKLALKIDGKSIQKGLGVSTSLWGRSRRLQSGPGTENIDF